MGNNEQVCIEKDNKYYFLSASKKTPIKKQIFIDKKNGKGSFFTTIYK